MFSSTKDEAKPQNAGYSVVKTLATTNSALELSLGDTTQVFKFIFPDYDQSITIKVKNDDPIFQEFFLNIFPRLNKIQADDPIPAYFLTVITRGSMLNRLTELCLTHCAPSDAEIEPFIHHLELGKLPQLNTLKFDAWQLSRDSLHRLAKLDVKNISLTNKKYELSINIGDSLLDKELEKTLPDKVLKFSLRNNSPIFQVKQGKVITEIQIDPLAQTTLQGPDLESYRQLITRCQAASEQDRFSDENLKLTPLEARILSRIALKCGYEILSTFTRRYNDKDHPFSTNADYLFKRKTIENGIKNETLLDQSYQFDVLTADDILRYKEKFFGKQNKNLAEVCFIPKTFLPHIDFFVFLLTSDNIRISTLTILDLEKTRIPPLITGPDNNENTETLPYVTCLLEALKKNQTIRELRIHKPLSAAERKVLAESLCENKHIQYLYVHFSLEDGHITCPLLESKSENTVPTSHLKSLHIKTEAKLEAATIQQYLTNSPCLEFFNIESENKLSEQEQESVVTQAKHHPNLLEAPFLKNFQNENLFFERQDYIAAGIALYQWSRNPASSRHIPAPSIEIVKLILEFLIPVIAYNLSVKEVSWERNYRYTAYDEKKKASILQTQLLLKENMLAKYQCTRLLLFSGPEKLKEYYNIHRVQPIKNDMMMLYFAKDYLYATRPGEIIARKKLTANEYQNLKKYFSETDLYQEVKKDEPLFNELVQLCDCFRWNAAISLPATLSRPSPYRLFKLSDERTRRYYEGGKKALEEDKSSPSISLTPFVPRNNSV